MAIDKETLKIRLAEAEEAYHKLMIGVKEVSVNVGNFGSVSYNQTNRAELAAPNWPLIYRTSNPS